jgi:hypothetical protein
VRSGVGRWLVVVAFGLCWAAPGFADPTGPGATPAGVTEAARAHFKTGIRLFQAQTYEGALAEFEASYELKPGPGSLQNIALCQKALSRYADAVDSLTRLLARHGAELSGAERNAAERARDELAALVGSVRLTVEPPNADVTLDGKVLPPAARTATLRLNTGEHTFGASAPGYASVTKSVRVTSAHEELPVELTLTPTGAFLDVRSTDPSAAIAIDGQAVGIGHHVAEVTPNAEHLVQIYKQGVPAFEAHVKAELGQTVVVSGSPGQAAAAPNPAPSSTDTAATPTAAKAIGWYVLGSASLLTTSSTPFRFDLSQAKSRAFGLGARGGYRLRPPIALEGLVEFDWLKVEHACDEPESALAVTPVVCGDPHEVVANYLVRSLRFGPTLELMTTGPRLRAQGGIGAGAVWHELRLGKNENDGVDAYLLIEIGVGANTDHVLFSLEVQTILDGTHDLVQGRSIGPGGSTEEHAFERSGGVLAFVGLNLRVGYSQWAP